MVSVLAQHPGSTLLNQTNDKTIMASVPSFQYSLRVKKFDKVGRCSET